MEKTATETLSPGAVALEACKASGMNPQALAALMLFNDAEWNEFVAGTREITNGQAGLLGSVFGTTIDFWLILQHAWSNRNQFTKKERRR